ncbi:MAG: hypothetical protein HY059_09285 [Proteobacteria bacterium]|nr:hypothetical protein [Pseudomonadota bacterium]
MLHNTQVRHAVRRSEKAAEGMLKEARAKGEVLAEKFREKGVEFFDEAQVSGRHALKDAKGWVARNPVWAIGAAFLIGTIAKGMMRRGGD